VAESKGPTYAAVVAIVLGGVLLSLIAGCIGGAVAGYLAAAVRPSKPEVQVPFPYWGKPPDLPQRFPRVPGLPPEEFGPLPHFWSGGALVRHVEPESPAQEAGIETADIITAVNGEPVNEDHPLDQILQTYRPGDKVQITLTRGDRERTIEVKLGTHPDDETRPYLGIRFSTLTTPFPQRGD